jgi:mycothiol synthase
VRGVLPDAVWTSTPDVGAVLDLAAAAAEADGVAPLSEQTLLELRRPGQHLSVVDAGALLGYASPGDGTGELVVAPTARHRGVGRALLGALLDRTPAVWAHGDLPAAQALAAAVGLRRERVLWQLRRDARAALPVVGWPSGVSVRTFVPGRDEAAWLALNARAFAHHPEQGHWQANDLEAREGEPWFDPAGFFLAESGGKLVGFHWTKVEDGLGEVYVVGVDPDRAGAGLGRSLTLRGLQRLRDVGVATVRLYVDEDNPRALGMYERLGFARFRADVTYLRN